MHSAEYEAQAMPTRHWQPGLPLDFGVGLPPSLPNDDRLAQQTADSFGKLNKIPVGGQRNLRRQRCPSSLFRVRTPACRLPRDHGYGFSLQYYTPGHGMLY